MRVEQGRSPGGAIAVRGVWLVGGVLSGGRGMGLGYENVCTGMGLEIWDRER